MPCARTAILIFKIQSILNIKIFFVSLGTDASRLPRILSPARLTLP